MVIIEELVEAARRQKRLSGSRVNWPAAITEAIEGKGVRHKPDIEKLEKLILEQLRMDGTIPRRGRW